MVHAGAENKCAGRCSDILVSLLELVEYLGSFLAQVFFSQNKVFSIANFPPEKHIGSWNAVFSCVTIPYLALSTIGIRQWIATTLRQIHGIAVLDIRVQKEKSNESLGQQSHSNIYLTQLRPISSHTFTFFICAVFYAPDNAL